jgi:hypothetical protein
MPDEVETPEAVVEALEIAIVTTAWQMVSCDRDDAPHMARSIARWITYLREARGVSPAHPAIQLEE